MDLQNFSIGIGIYLATYLYYRWLIKDNPPASENTQGNGYIMPVYIGLWGSLILMLIAGTSYLIKAF